MDGKGKFDAKSIGVGKWEVVQVVRFNDAKHPAALSYAAVSSGPEQIDAMYVWKLERKNRLLENENRLLWVVLLLCWGCWIASLVAVLWLADKI